MLPFPAAFGLPGRQVWVHTEEEFHAIRVAAGRVIPQEGNPAWEQQNNPDEEQGQEGWGEEGWNDYGQGHNTSRKATISNNTSNSSSNLMCSHSRDMTMSLEMSSTHWLLVSVTWRAHYMT